MSLLAEVKIPLQEPITVVKDGNMYCAYRTKTFINLQESHAEFAETPWAAINMLIEGGN